MFFGTFKQRGEKHKYGLTHTGDAVKCRAADASCCLKGRYLQEEALFGARRFVTPVSAPQIDQHNPAMHDERAKITAGTACVCVVLWWEPRKNFTPTHLFTKYSVRVCTRCRR